MSSSVAMANRSDLPIRDLPVENRIPFIHDHCGGPYHWCSIIQKSRDSDEGTAETHLRISCSFCGLPHARVVGSHEDSPIAVAAENLRPENATVIGHELDG